MFIKASNKVQKCLNQIKFYGWHHILVIFPSYLIFFCSKVGLWIKKYHKKTSTGFLFKGISYGLEIFFFLIFLFLEYLGGASLSNSPWPSPKKSPLVSLTDKEKTKKAEEETFRNLYPFLSYSNFFILE